MESPYLLLVDRTDDPSVGKVITEEYATSTLALAAANTYAQTQGITSSFYTRTSTIAPGTPTVTPG